MPRCVVVSFASSVLLRTSADLVAPGMFVKLLHGCNIMRVATCTLLLMRNLPFTSWTTSFCCVQLASQMQGQAGLGRAPQSVGSQLSGQDAEQLALLRQMQLSGQLPANYGSASTGGTHSAYGSVSSAPGAGFRAPSPLAVGGQRAQSPAFGTSFGGGTISPAYSTTSLPGVLGLPYRPGSAFGSASISGGPVTTDPVIRRPSPSPSITSHASKQGKLLAMIALEHFHVERKKSLRC